MSQVVSKAGSRGRIQDAAWHTLPAGSLLSCLPGKGWSLPYGLSSAGISQAAGWRILSPWPPISAGTAQAVSQGFAQQGLKAAGTKALSRVVSSPSLWALQGSGMETCLLCCAPVLSHRWRRCSLPRALPWAVSMGKGHRCPIPTSKPLPRVPCCRQGGTAGLTEGKQLGHCGCHCPPRLMLCSLSVCLAVPQAGCHAQGRVPWLHEYPAGSGSAQVWMGPTAHGAVRAAWGGGHWQRWADAPGLSLCRAPGPSPGCTPQCVPRECPGPSGVRPWGQGVQGAPPLPARCNPHTVQRHTCVVFSRSSRPTVAQPVPLLVQCPPANRRGTESP